MEEVSGRELEHKRNRELIREICKKEPTFSKNLFVTFSENKTKIVFSVLHIEYWGPRYVTSKIFKREGSEWYLITRNGNKKLKTMNFLRERNKLLKKADKFFVIEAGKIISEGP